MPRPRAILIAGPTASGKSALALRLAERYGAVVVNADSMQVYRELEILTARPGPADLARAEHRLYGHVPAAEAYSVGRWLRDIEPVLAETAASGRLAVIVGGTGLYFKALLAGLAEIPQIDPQIRSRWRERSAQTTAAELHAELQRRDPAMAARLAATDAQRLVRALEVVDATGRSLADWQATATPALIEQHDTMRLLLACDREALYARCDARFDAMIAAGALDEVRRLAALGLASELPAMRAVGVPPLLAHLRGELALGEAIARAKLDTRHYVKRQLTWARSNMMSWTSVEKQFNYEFCSVCFPIIDSWVDLAGRRA